MEGATRFIEQRVINGNNGFSSLLPIYRLRDYKEASFALFNEYKPIAIFKIKFKNNANK